MTSTEVTPPTATEIREVANLLAKTDRWTFLSAVKQLHWFYVRRDMGWPAKPLKDQWLEPLTRMRTHKEVRKVFDAVKAVRAKYSTTTQKQRDEERKQAKRDYMRNYSKLRRMEKRMERPLKPGDPVVVTKTCNNQAPGNHGTYITMDKRLGQPWVQMTHPEHPVLMDLDCLVHAELYANSEALAKIVARRKSKLLGFSEDEVVAALPKVELTEE